MFSNIVDQECTGCTTVVGVGDGSNFLVAGSVPDLNHDVLSVDVEGFGGELDSDGGVELEGEFVVAESGE